jgi:hypothetical protein
MGSPIAIGSHALEPYSPSREYEMSRSIWTPQFILILAALTPLAGCSRGPVVAEVVGIVKLDGKPVPNVKIMFMPDPVKGTVGPISAGLTDDEGHFKLKCEDERDGAVVGWHRVVVFDGNQNLYRTPRNGRRDDDAPVVKQKPRAQGPHVPDKYSTSAKTPLELEVKDTKNNLEIPLTR